MSLALRSHPEWDWILVVFKVLKLHWLGLGDLKPLFWIWNVLAFNLAHKDIWRVKNIGQSILKVTFGKAWWLKLPYQTEWGDNWLLLAEAWFCSPLQLSDSAGEEDPADLKNAQKGKNGEVEWGCAWHPVGDMGQWEGSLSLVILKILEYFWL